MYYVLCLLLSPGLVKAQHDSEEILFLLFENLQRVREITFLKNTPLIVLVKKSVRNVSKSETPYQVAW